MTDVTPPIHVSGVPLDSRAGRRLKAGEGGWAEHLGDRLHLLPSLFVSWLVANAGVVVLATGVVALGFFVTKVLLSIDAVVTADEWLPIWVEGQRTPFLDDASYVTSNLADRYVLIPLVGIVGIFFILRRRWRMASFVLQAALAEILCYALVVYFVARPRPPVEQMDPFNLTHSYPSGHVAASVAIYGSLTLLLAAHFKDIRRASRDLEHRRPLPAGRDRLADLPRRASPDRRHRRSVDGRRRVVRRALRGAHLPPGRRAAQGAA